MKLEVTHDEALVLFEWLARLDEQDASRAQHQAENYVLWSLQGQLERTLAEPFRADYDELLGGARERVLASHEDVESSEADASKRAPSSERTSGRKGCASALAALDRLIRSVELAPDEWENPTVPRYLESMRAWLEASQRKSPREPSWELIADLLEAGKIYE